MRRILLLSNNSNVNPLFNWLIEQGYDVSIMHEPLTQQLVQEKFRTSMPDLVISHNYRYIVDEEIIRFFDNKIINMHISLLPWNRGASPHIWSLIDDTPKGVTIHRMEKGLDTGAIILQKELIFDENEETLTSSYEKLNREIINLLIENWSVFESGDFHTVPQNGKGSYHRIADLEKLLNGRVIDYGMTIADFKRFIHKTC